MNHFNNIRYVQLIEDYRTIWKRIQPYEKKRTLTENINLLAQYRLDIVRVHNAFINYIQQHFEHLQVDKRTEVLAQAVKTKERTLRAFAILLLRYDFSDDTFEIIDAENIVISDTTENNDNINNEQIDQPAGAAANSAATGSGTSSVATEATGSADSQTRQSDVSIVNLQLRNSEKTATTDSIHSSLSDLVAQSIGNNSFDNINGNLINLNDNLLYPNIPIHNVNQENQTVMVNQSKADFLKLAASIINYKFNGDALKLQSFLTDVELVEGLAEHENEALCVKFIKAKLEAKALECLPEVVNTVKDITDALSANIKPESSKVIEGKIMAMRIEKGNFTKFSEQAEKLAEAFRRSLIVEGITKQKAQELTIMKTVEICRKTARSEVVKSILASATFAQPQEVISRLITENAIASREKREKDAAQQNKQKFVNKKGFNKHTNGSNNRNNSNQNYNQNRNHNGNKNYNGGYRNNNGGQRNYNNNGGQRSQNRNEHNVRYVQGDAQPSTSRADENEQQVFRLRMD